MLYFAIVLGIAAIAALAWFAGRSHSSALEAQLAALRQQGEAAQLRVSNIESQLEARGADLGHTKELLATAIAERRAVADQIAEKDKNLAICLEELALTREEVLRLTADNSSLNTAVDEQKKSHEGQLKLWNDAEQRLKDTFDAMASRALQGNNQQFLELAKQEMEKQQQHAKGDLEFRKMEVEHLVRPISETLEKLGKEVREIENKREGAYSEIRTQIEGLKISGDQIKSEASRLVNALKMPQQRGRWGEIQLRNVVALAGMVRYCDFDEQVTTRDDENRVFRPDMTVRLPGGRTIVVDSKVALKAYLEATDCEDEAQRNTKLKEHAAQLKQHLQALSQQSYWKQFENTPEFVVAFLPLESLFSSALQQDPTLIEFGAEQRVVLATPTTLIALLKAVSYGWRQEDVAKNAQQISELGKDLYERLATMYGYIDKLRGSLNSAVTHFNSMVGSFESRVIVGARKFKELRATAADDIREIQPVENTPRVVNGKPPTVIRALAASAVEGSGD